MSAVIELCPFCGSSLVMYPNDVAERGREMGVPGTDAFYSHCESCGMDGPVGDDHDQAIELSNQRAPQAQGALPDALPELPKPDTHCYDEDLRTDVWSHSAEQMHAYAKQYAAAIRAQQYTVSDTARLDAPPGGGNG